MSRRRCAQMAPDKGTLKKKQKKKQNDFSFTTHLSYDGSPPTAARSPPVAWEAAEHLMQEKNTDAPEALPVNITRVIVKAYQSTNSPLLSFNGFADPFAQWNRFRPASPPPMKAHMHTVLCGTFNCSKACRKQNVAHNKSCRSPSSVFILNTADMQVEHCASFLYDWLCFPNFNRTLQRSQKQKKKRRKMLGKVYLVLFS